MKFKNTLPVIVLVSICLVSALLLSLVNMVTAPIIEASRNQLVNEKLLVVLPDGKNFEPIVTDETYPASVTEAYRADGGFVFVMSVTGKSSGLIIMCGVSEDGKIVGTTVVESKETPEYASKVFPSVEGLEGVYKDVDAEGFEPYLVAGATLTSNAYGEAINAALQAYTIANGGAVDLRTPEQIFQDNCNAALGTSGLTYKRWFATEVLAGVDAVYGAEGTDGHVYVIGETLVGVKADGTIVDLGDADEATVKAADAAVKASTPTEIPDITAITETVNTKIVKLKKIETTATGNYVFTVEAKGYAWLNSHYSTDTPIVIKVAISADGTIIDCFTVSHGESKDIGDVCATDKYYEQFRGASESDIKITVNQPDDYAQQIPAGSTDIGAISGATFTSSAYQKAVTAAFTAFNLLTVGGEA